jgi:hypothetical protein
MMLPSEAATRPLRSVDDPALKLKPPAGMKNNTGNLELVDTFDGTYTSRNRQSSSKLVSSGRFL